MIHEYNFTTYDRGQLKVLERNILYIKTPVVGTNIENRINRLGDTDNYDHFQHRR